MYLSNVSLQLALTPARELHPTLENSDRQHTSIHSQCNADSNLLLVSCLRSMQPAAAGLEPATHGSKALPTELTRPVRLLRPFIYCQLRFSRARLFTYTRVDFRDRFWHFGKTKLSCTTSLTFLTC